MELHALVQPPVVTLDTADGNHQCVERTGSACRFLVGIEDQELFVSARGSVFDERAVNWLTNCKYEGVPIDFSVRKASTAGVVHLGFLEMYNSGPFEQS